MTDIHEQQAALRAGTVARVRIGMAIAATALLGACSSDDTASVAETSVSSTSVLAGSAGRPEPTSTEPPIDEAPETTPAPGDSTDTDTDATTDCIVGEWALDGAQFVANAVAFHGEPVRYESGTYVYTFSDDGSFTVDVGLNIVIDGDEGPVRVESRGTEEGTWLVSDVSPEELALEYEFEPVGLPYVLIETTGVSVSETGFFDGISVPFGDVDQDQGLDGVGPIDCDAGTMVIRGTVPFPIDYPFTRM